MNRFKAVCRERFCSRKEPGAKRQEAKMFNLEIQRPSLGPKAPAKDFYFNLFGPDDYQGWT
jgi:hypothetical protein